MRESFDSIHRPRQLQRHPQPTLTQVLQRHLAAMAMGDVARNAKAQAITLLLPRQTEVRFEHLLQPLLRHTRPFVVDMQNKGAVIVIDVQMRVLSILQGVVDQIADAALERQRLARYADSARPCWVTRPLPFGARYGSTRQSST